MSPLISETFDWKDILAGPFPLVSTEVTVLSGSNLKRGTVLGLITASQKVVAVDDAAVDGSEIVHAVLSADVDATAGDLVGPAFLTGEFDSEKMIFGGGPDVIADHIVNARAKSIFFKKTSKTSGIFGF